MEAIVAEPQLARHGQKHHTLQLLLANLQSGAQKLREGAALLFVSASESTSANDVAQMFAVEMARYTGRRTIVVDSSRLQSLGIEDYLQMPRNCNPTNIENLWMLPAKKLGSNGNGHREKGDAPNRSFLMRVAKQGEEIDTGLNSVDALRVSFDNILIDCRSLRSSADAAILASSVDGVVVVADAGHSRRDEIMNAQRAIETAGGKFLGFVLNQRRYPIPEWL